MLPKSEQHMQSIKTLSVAKQPSKRLLVLSRSANVRVRLAALPQNQNARTRVSSCFTMRSSSRERRNGVTNYREKKINVKERRNGDGGGEEAVAVGRRSLSGWAAGRVEQQSNGANDDDDDAMNLRAAGDVDNVRRSSRSTNDNAINKAGAPTAAAGPSDKAKIRQKQPSNTRTFQIGDRIEAKYRGRGRRYYPGVIVGCAKKSNNGREGSVYSDGGYDVDYDDGDRDRGLSGRFIRERPADDSGGEIGGIGDYIRVEERNDVNDDDVMNKSEDGSSAVTAHNGIGSRKAGDYGEDVVLSLRDPAYKSIMFEHFRKVGAGTKCEAETAAEVVHRLLTERRGGAGKFIKLQNGTKRVEVGDDAALDKIKADFRRRMESSRQWLVVKETEGQQPIAEEATTEHKNESAPTEGGETQPSPSPTNESNNDSPQEEEEAGDDDGSWTCECGERYPAERKRCGKCHKWKAGSYPKSKKCVDDDGGDAAAAARNEDEGVGDSANDGCEDVVLSLRDPTYKSIMFEHFRKMGTSREEEEEVAGEIHVLMMARKGISGKFIKLQGGGTARVEVDDDAALERIKTGVKRRMESSKQWLVDEKAEDNEPSAPTNDEIIDTVDQVQQDELLASQMQQDETTSASRRSSVRRKSAPEKFVARPSRQGVGVKDGDEEFLAGVTGGGGDDEGDEGVPGPSDVEEVSRVTDMEGGDVDNNTGTALASREKNGDEKAHSSSVDDEKLPAVSNETNASAVGGDHDAPATANEPNDTSSGNNDINKQQEKHQDHDTSKQSNASKRQRHETEEEQGETEEEEGTNDEAQQQLLLPPPPQCASFNESLKLALDSYHASRTLLKHSNNPTTLTKPPPFLSHAEECAVRTALAFVVAKARRKEKKTPSADNNCSESASLVGTMATNNSLRPTESRTGDATASTVSLLGGLLPPPRRATAVTNNAAGSNSNLVLDRKLKHVRDILKLAVSAVLPLYRGALCGDTGSGGGGKDVDATTVDGTPAATDPSTVGRKPCSVYDYESAVRPSSISSNVAAQQQHASTLDGLCHHAVVRLSSLIREEELKKRARRGGVAGGGNRRSELKKASENSINDDRSNDDADGVSPTVVTDRSREGGQAGRQRAISTNHSSNSSNAIRNAIVKLIYNDLIGDAYLHTGNSNRACAERRLEQVMAVCHVLHRLVYLDKGCVLGTEVVIAICSILSDLYTNRYHGRMVVNGDGDGLLGEQLTNEDGESSKASSNGSSNNSNNSEERHRQNHMNSNNRGAGEKEKHQVVPSRWGAVPSSSSSAGYNNINDRHERRRNALGGIISQQRAGAKRLHSSHDDEMDTANEGSTKDHALPLPRIGDVLAVNLLRLLEGAAAIRLHHRQQRAVGAISSSTSSSHRHRSSSSSQRRGDREYIVDKAASEAATEVLKEIRSSTATKEGGGELLLPLHVEDAALFYYNEKMRRSSSGGRTNIGDGSKQLLLPGAKMMLRLHLFGLMEKLALYEQV